MPRRWPNARPACGSSIAPAPASSTRTTSRPRWIPARSPAPPSTCSSPSRPRKTRSEEHTSELQLLMRISYAVFCLKKKNKTAHDKRENKTKHQQYDIIENKRQQYRQPTEHE